MERPSISNEFIKRGNFSLHRQVCVSRSEPLLEEEEVRNNVLALYSLLALSRRSENLECMEIGEIMKNKCGKGGKDDQVTLAVSMIYGCTMGGSSGWKGVRSMLSS